MIDQKLPNAPEMLSKSTEEEVCTSAELAMALASRAGRM
jgi:hypothetical protein